MNFLIFTHPEDHHALVVQLLLESLGHQVRLFFGADQPSLLTHSVAVNAETTSWHSSDWCGAYPFDQAEVIWWRRAHKPWISASAVHPDDYEFVCRENDLFFDALVTSLSRQAWWVNPRMAAKRSQAKLYQLQLAKAVGLTIPNTLCSNYPSDIRQFIKQHAAVGVIYKPLCSFAWFEKAGIKAIYTTLLTESSLPEDDVLRLTPGLFQPFIKKAYELRITCFGSRCVAVKVQSAESQIGEIDWRAVPDASLLLEPYTLPRSIEIKLQTLMRSLGIVFGCVDMIVTPEGEYVFLEINEQGQFLWIEERLPSVPLLDLFVHFLMARSFYFHWEAFRIQHRLADYLAETRRRYEKNVSDHVMEQNRRAS